jgi:ankyrin repeat protein
LRASNGFDGETKKSLIDQLYFIRIDERLTTLTAAQGTTCRWFLSKPEYASWQDEAQQQNHGGFLWIKGNPGTGKSTLMKFLFENAKLNAKDASCLTLSFFFLARGMVEEKSTSGLYHSLLHQLFEKAPELTDSLEWLTADGAKVIERNGWEEETLKQTLSHAIRKLGYRSLTIFIDALDECDRSQVVDMICFLEELCDNAGEAQVRLQICLSSRHYPTVVIQKGIEVTLEDESGHTEDIKQYIQSKLRIGKLKQAESVRSDILEMSSRVFLWVALVIDILNSEYSNNPGSMKQLRARLHEIPPKLSDLFEMILERDGDRDDAKRVQLCLKWILFATRPLKPQELYFAIQFGLDKSCTGYWDQEDVDLNQMETFVRNSSKGLAEVTLKARDVQFIHESVRDFLVNKYEKQWSGISGNFVGDCHVLLRDCCLAQLTAPIDQVIGIPNSLPNGTKANVSSQEITQKYPFLRYSIDVLQHSDSAEKNKIAQGGFLSVFPLQRWVHASNAYKPTRGTHNTESVSLLYVLAQLDLGNLIRIHPRREFCFDVENEPFGTPLLAALGTSSYRAVQVFLEVHAGLQPEEASLRDLCKRYSENRIEPIHYFGRLEDARKRNLSSYAAEFGDEGIITFLCAVGKFDFESKDYTGRSPLSWASECAPIGIIQLLLQHGADIESRDNTGRTPLAWAAARYSRTTVIIQALLEKGAHFDSKDNTGRTPLSWAAAQSGSIPILQELLKKGADIESRDNTGRTPLSWATGWFTVTPVLEELLEKGPDIESKDNTGRTPLSWAASYGEETILQFLLEKGADPKSKDNNGQTPNSWAKKARNKVAARLLREASDC